MAEVFGFSTLTTSVLTTPTSTNSAGSLIQGTVTLFTPAPTSSGIVIIGGGNGVATTDWESSPQHRGTFSILTTCGATLLLCIWGGLHLNVPKTQKNGSNGAGTTLATSVARVARRKGFWMLVGLLAPELLVYMAWYQFILARRLTHRMREWIKEDNSRFEWTMMHSFFALMGGIHGYGPDRDHAVALKADGLERQFTQKPNDLRTIDRSAIEDRSKKDYMGKFLVCVQASYVLLQVTSRLRSRLPITLLEINTVGHIICALAMYGFWWSKPLEVHDPIYLQCNWLETHSEEDSDLFADHMPDWPDTNALAHLNTFGRYGPFAAIAFASGLYGGLHLSAWNIYFPSMIEQRMWRISGITIAGTGVLLAVFIAFFWLIRWLIDWVSDSDADSFTSQDDYSESSTGPKRQVTVHTGHQFWMRSPAFITVLFIYALARSFIVVEAFISLRRLPLGAYDIPGWTVWWPVFGSS